MSIVNRRNAVLGWSVWTLSKQAAKRKAKQSAPHAEGGRPNKPLLAVSLAGLIGAIAFWRRFRHTESA
jgi:hypothetical protein